MSGIYIKGMEMPKNCIDCPCYYPEYYECNIIHNCNPIYHNDPIPQYCPLVAVPDHGRLIDADALIDNANPLVTIRGRQMYFQSDIHNAPTIIPADKEKNNG